MDELNDNDDLIQNIGMDVIDHEASLTKRNKPREEMLRKLYYETNMSLDDTNLKTKTSMSAHYNDTIKSVGVIDINGSEVFIKDPRRFANVLEESYAVECTPKLDKTLLIELCFDNMMEAENDGK